MLAFYGQSRDSCDIDYPVRTASLLTPRDLMFPYHALTVFRGKTATTIYATQRTSRGILLFGESVLHL